MTHVPHGTFDKVELPFPPSGNRYWRVSGKRIVKSREAFIYQNTVRLIVTKKRRVFYEGRLIAHVELYPPDDKPRDLDNHVKILLDALETAEVFCNDSQIDILLVERKEIKAELPVAVVTIMETKDASICLTRNNSETSSSIPL